MSESAPRVVFDCNIFAQAIISPTGSAGRCVEETLNGKVRLFWSDYVLAEIRRLPDKPTPRKLGVTLEIVERFIARLVPIATRIESPPSVYQHPHDPKDSHYVDLAVAS